jgi:hypothetical protein
VQLVEGKEQFDFCLAAEGHQRTVRGLRWQIELNRLG